MNAAAKKYVVEFLSAMTLYSLSIFSMPTLLGRVDPDGVLIWFVALIPVIPTGLVVYAIVRHYRRMDELERRILGEVNFIAAMITLFASFAYGFLESYVDAPPVPIILLAPAFFMIWIPTWPLVARRYA